MPYDWVLLLHSIIGVLVFGIGLLQIVLKKGGKIHIWAGRVYLYAWLVLLLTGAYMGGAIITTVGVFGFYFALTGARIGQLKTKALGFFDKAIFFFGGVVSLAMLGYALMLYLRGSLSFAIILLVFGLIFLSTTVKDIAKYNFGKPLEKQKYGSLDWYFEHFKRMLISFIAAVTAFASIQNVFGENTLNFLMPTVIGTLGIIWLDRSYRKKMLSN